MATAKKKRSAAKGTGAPAANRAAPRTAKGGTVKETQLALGKEDHEPVTWGNLRAVHGEGGSVDVDDDGDELEGDEGDEGSEG